MPSSSVEDGDDGIKRSTYLWIGSDEGDDDDLLLASLEPIDTPDFDLWMVLLEQRRKE